MNRPKGKVNAKKRTPKKRTLVHPKVKRMTLGRLLTEINKTPANEQGSLRYKQLTDNYHHKMDLLDARENRAARNLLAAAKRLNVKKSKVK